MGMTARAHELVAELEKLRVRFGTAAARRKLALLASLGAVRSPDAQVLLRLHEALLYHRAFPDSRAVLVAAEDGLAAFAARLEALRRRDPEAAAALDGSGLAATSVSAYWSLPIVRWLVASASAAVALNHDEEGVDERLTEVLPRLVLSAEAEALEDGYLDPWAWLKRTSGRGRSSDVARLLSLLDAQETSADGRDGLWKAWNLPLDWELGTSRYSRTLARAPQGELALQRRPFERAYPDLQAEVARGAPTVARLSAAEAARWIDLGRAALATRLREVYSLNHASPDDVWLAGAGEGLRIALYGVTPARRHALRTFYGYLLVMNDVPIGYGDAILVCDWGELNFHVFDTFRGVASAQLYAAVVRLFRHHLGPRYLHLNPYQFGRHSQEAIDSGAFWFYEKLGFRPREAVARRLWRAERRRLDAGRGYRTGPATLKRLARSPMALALDRPEGPLEALYGGFHPLRVGLALTRAVESRHGGDRREATRKAGKRVAALLGGHLKSDAGDALARFAPILDLVPDLDDWTRDERRALRDLVDAKAAPSERDFLTLARGHERFRAAIVALGS